MGNSMNIKWVFLNIVIVYSSLQAMDPESSALMARQAIPAVTKKSVKKNRLADCIDACLQENAHMVLLASCLVYTNHLIGKVASLCAAHNHPECRWTESTLPAASEIVDLLLGGCSAKLCMSLTERFIAIEKSCAGSVSTKRHPAAYFKIGAFYAISTLGWMGIGYGLRQACQSYQTGMESDPIEESNLLYATAYATLIPIGYGAIKTVHTIVAGCKDLFFRNNNSTKRD
jgi:hypothetical protein